MSPSKAAVLAACVIVLAAGSQRVLAQQKISNMDRERAEEMLQIIRDEVKEHYYDPKYHGLDLDARCKIYEDRIKQATSLGAAFTDIAAFLSGLHDSHTFFIPSLRSSIFDYGFRMEMIGDKAYVTELRPDSDAATKLHPGDEILTLDRYRVSREDFEDLSYYLNTLSPQFAVNFDLRDPSGVARHVTVKTRMEARPPYFDPGSDDDADFWLYTRQNESLERLLHDRWKEVGDALIWKIAGFYDDNEDVDRMIDRAKGYRKLIIDLRGNTGGSGEMVERMVGDLVDHDVMIAKRVARKPERPAFAKTRGKNAFAGKLIVLVDSQSESASEIFARTMQLEHRGIIVGDETAGRVMGTQFYPERIETDRYVFYGVAITDANLIMSDGKSLEGVGVTPDVIVLPSAADLAAGRDPALSKAAELAGVKLDPAAAGKLFPFEWAPFSAE